LKISLWQEAHAADPAKVGNAVAGDTGPGLKAAHMILPVNITDTIIKNMSAFIVTV
jgi:hypothetical protein